MNTDYLNLVDRHIVTENKTHKHKRAEKQYEDYYTAYDDEDVELCHDNYYEEFIPCEMFPTIEDFLDEISMNHYEPDFDWMEALYEGGEYDMYFDRNIVLNNINFKEKDDE